MKVEVEKLEGKCGVDLLMADGRVVGSICTSACEQCVHKNKKESAGICLICQLTDSREQCVNCMKTGEQGECQFTPHRSEIDELLLAERNDNSLAKKCDVVLENSTVGTLLNYLIGATRELHKVAELCYTDLPVEKSDLSEWLGHVMFITAVLNEKCHITDEVFQSAHDFADETLCVIKDRKGD